MSEYIEREAVMQSFADYVWNSNHSDLVPAPQWNHAVDIVRDFPAADVVEVVRCSECKWYRESKLLGPTKFCFRLKDRDGKPIGYNFADNDYCSHGERKGGDVDDQRG
jgi:hypothetical protein